MKRNFFNMFLVISIGTLALACKKESGSSEQQPLEATTINDLGADTSNTGHYTFFRMKDGAILSYTDSADGGWDLGFAATNIIVNGGSSGPGSGGAFIYNGLFGDLTEVPADSSFKQDNAAARAITGWYLYTGTTTEPNHAILPVPGKIIVLRTSDNKYAKVEILSYYKGNPNTGSAEFADLAKRPKSRFYTFRYMYQADGSTQLK